MLTAGEHWSNWKHRAGAPSHIAWRAHSTHPPQLRPQRSRPVDHERDRPITRLYDHYLIAGSEEHIPPQFRHAIEHEWRELMQLNVLRDLGAEREPQMDASVREIRRDALSNDIHFLHAKMQASHVR